MKKVYCDICGEEIKRENETWEYKLKTNKGNKRVSMNKNIKEICERCVTVLDCCTAMLKIGLEPEWKEKGGSRV